MNREEIKHTPGPWWVEGGDPDAASWAARWPNIHADGYEVVGAQGLYGDYDTDMANARLIAAAPDLLAELQWMRNHWEPTEGKVGNATLLNAKGDEICEWMARVDSVLARCTPQPAEAIRARGMK